MSPFLILILLGCAVVAVILAMGVGQMGRGGEEGAKKSNSLMKMRIIAQAVVVLALVLGAWLGFGA